MEQERANYKQRVAELNLQIEDLIKEQMKLEAEVEFLKKQNSELRQDIGII